VRESRPPESAGPAPVITPKIGVGAETGKRRNLPDVPLVVAVKFSSKVHKPRAEVIYNNFAVRLGEHMKVTSFGVAKRDEAVKRAGDALMPYVVFLDLDIDAFQNGAIVFNSPDIVVRYNVIDVRTKETMAKGKIYYQAMGGARQRGADEPVRITAEAAGEEAAERVLDWFSLPTNLSR